MFLISKLEIFKYQLDDDAGAGDANWIRYAPTSCIMSSQTNGLHIQGSCGTIPLSAGEALESRHAALHFVNEANAH